MEKASATNKQRFRDSLGRPVFFDAPICLLHNDSKYLLGMAVESNRQSAGQVGYSACLKRLCDVDTTFRLKQCLKNNPFGSPQ